MRTFADDARESRRYRQDAFAAPGVAFRCRVSQLVALMYRSRPYGTGTFSLCVRRFSALREGRAAKYLMISLDCDIWPSHIVARDCVLSYRVKHSGRRRSEAPRHRIATSEFAQSHQFRALTSIYFLS
jgi:hypothetical protein